MMNNIANLKALYNETINLERQNPVNEADNINLAVQKWLEVAQAASAFSENYIKQNQNNLEIGLNDLDLSVVIGLNSLKNYVRLLLTGNIVQDNDLIQVVTSATVASLTYLEELNYRPTKEQAKIDEAQIIWEEVQNYYKAMCKKLSISEDLHLIRNHVKSKFIVS